MNELPSGTVTFLFTDIEDSTRFRQEQPEVMSSAHAQHNAILYEVIEANNGFIFQTVGDSISAAIHNTVEALRAAGVDASLVIWPKMRRVWHLKVNRNSVRVPPWEATNPRFRFLSLTQAPAPVSSAALQLTLLRMSRGRVAPGRFPGTGYVPFAWALPSC